MEIRNSSVPARTRVMGSSRHGVTQTRSFFTQCLTGATGKKDHAGSQRLCLCVLHAWGAAADSAFPQMPRCQKGWATVGRGTVRG